jgi:hypothetical protein
MATVRRVTHRTDNRGNLLEQYRSAFELQALDAARLAGIPRRLLDPAGWSGDEADLTGFWAEQVYDLSDCLERVERDMDVVERPISWMVRLSEQFGVDYREAMAIPFDGARLLRSIKDSRDRASARTKGDVPMATLDDLEITWPVTW